MAQTVGNAIKIDGLRELQASLKLLPKEVKLQFAREMKDVADEVVVAVRGQMPEQSGAARASVKTSFAGGYLAVVAGGTSVPYYPWLDFGGDLKATGKRKNTQHRPFFKQGRWIYPTIARHRASLYARAVEAVEKAKRATGL